MYMYVYVYNIYICTCTFTYYRQVVIHSKFLIHMIALTKGNAIIYIRTELTCITHCYTYVCRHIFTVEKHLYTNASYRDPPILGYFRSPEFFICRPSNFSP